MHDVGDTASSLGLHNGRADDSGTVHVDKAGRNSGVARRAGDGDKVRVGLSLNLLADKALETRLLVRLNTELLMEHHSGSIILIHELITIENPIISVDDYLLSSHRLLRFYLRTHFHVGRTIS